MNYFAPLSVWHARGWHAPLQASQQQTLHCGLLLLAFLSASGVIASVAAANERSAVSFRRDIRPILSDRCFQCHGPDEQARQADLRLDRRADAVGVLSPEEPQQSELLRRIFSKDADEQMPPASSKQVLDSAEKEMLRQWVKDGATYETHWAFELAGKPSIPQPNRRDWARNPIDHFVLSRLEATGQKPAAEASKQQLIRRLTFDLTGLPPTLEQIDAFLADNSPDAYERLIDRLLASSDYGVRMAADWLDVARYSDTYGYQVDRDRSVWPWRDWLVRSLNENLRYDEFITQQLAGDLLPHATHDQILATTFNRLHPQKVEGGSVPEEFRVEYVADRNHTFATAFLGLTLECARCHDHKFDPISQREYYQLFAFFNNIDEAGLYSYFTPSVPTPTLPLASDEQARTLAHFSNETAAAEEELATVDQRQLAAFDRWSSDAARLLSEDLIPGQIAHLDFEDFDKSSATAPGNRSVAGRVGRGVRLSGDDGIKLEVGNFARYQPFTVALWMKTPDYKERAVIFHRSRAWTDAGSRGYQLLLENGRLSASLIHFWPGNALRIRMREELTPDEWHHVAISYDGSSRAAGLNIFLNGRSLPCDTVRDGLSRMIIGGGGDEITIGERFRDRGFTGGLVDEFRVFSRQLTAIEVSQLHNGKALRDLAERDTRQRSDEENEHLLQYYLSAFDTRHQSRLAALLQRRKRLAELQDTIDEIMVMRELADRRDTYVLRRGLYDSPTEKVRPATPQAFPPFPADGPRNRLGLARWLTDPGHPLASRVAVNRIWKLLFGDGLVRTPEDFGSQGSPPTHPLLLDWLAYDFVERGWDTKLLIKQVVNSATYRQDARSSADIIRDDPGNHALRRGPRYRLPAEMIRDGALAASGLLVRQLGGPPAKPLEVSVSFKPVTADEGAGLYRRSLYTYWKRTSPAPVMMTLDAAKRDVCTVERERTKSPLQALVLLNDPLLAEAACEIGRRALLQQGDDVTAAIVQMFRLLTSRFPSEAETEVLRQLFHEQLEYYRTHEADAARFIGMSDDDSNLPTQFIRYAAAGMVASTIMNLDACVSKQ